MPLNVRYLWLALQRAVNFTQLKIKDNHNFYSSESNINPFNSTVSLVISFYHHHSFDSQLSAMSSSNSVKSSLTSRDEVECENQKIMLVEHLQYNMTSEQKTKIRTPRTTKKNELRLSEDLDDESFIPSASTSPCSPSLGRQHCSSQVFWHKSLATKSG